MTGSVKGSGAKRFAFHSRSARSHRQAWSGWGFPDKLIHRSCTTGRSPQLNSCVGPARSANPGCPARRVMLAYDAGSVAVDDGSRHSPPAVHTSVFFQLKVAFRSAQGGTLRLRTNFEARPDGARNNRAALSGKIRLTSRPRHRNPTGNAAG